MPNPIEPSPITATRGFAESDSGIRRYLRFPHRRIQQRLGLWGITAWPRCQSMRQGGKQVCGRDTAVSETKIREEICRLGRSLFERGLTPGSSGNISVGLDDGGWLVTPTNASLGSLDPARLSRLDPDGRLLSGDAPTKEVPLHAALYQTRRTARAVVHLHSTHSVALSMLPEIDPRAALPPMTAYYLMKCGATALVPYYRPGDPAVADAIKGLAGKYASVLLANHGPVVAGETLEAAVFAIEELEETAKLYLLLRGLNPRYLTPEQVKDLSKTFGLELPEHGHEH
jgi:3-dehydro-4-phosphotetronate decarboxylase